MWEFRWSIKFRNFTLFQSECVFLDWESFSVLSQRCAHQPRIMHLNQKHGFRICRLDCHLRMNELFSNIMNSCQSIKNLLIHFNSTKPKSTGIFRCRSYYRTPWLNTLMCLSFVLLHHLDVRFPFWNKVLHYTSTSRVHFTFLFLWISNYYISSLHCGTGFIVNSALNWYLTSEPCDSFTPLSR